MERKERRPHRGDSSLRWYGSRILCGEAPSAPFSNAASVSVDHHDSGSACGQPSVLCSAAGAYRALRPRVFCCRNTVAKLMRREHIVPRAIRKFRITTARNEMCPAGAGGGIRAVLLIARTSCTGWDRVLSQAAPQFCYARECRARYLRPTVLRSAEILPWIPLNYHHSPFAPESADLRLSSGGDRNGNGSFGA